MRGTYRVWLVLGVLAAASPSAEALVLARQSAGQSVELKVAYAQAVVRGVVLTHAPEKVEGESFATMTIRVDEVLKGPIGAGETIRVVTRNTDAYTWYDQGRGGREYLFFLVTGESVVPERMPTPRQAEAWRSAPWALPDYAYNPPIPLFGKLPPVMAYLHSTRAVLGTRPAVLEAVRREVASAPAKRLGPPHTLQLSADRGPHTLPLAELNVVLDARSEEAALKWARSPHPMDRWNAVGVFEKFRSPRVIEALRALCGDDFWTPDDHWPGSSGFSPIVGRKWRSDPYPIRVAAWELLKKWGVHVDDVALYRPALAGMDVSRRWWLAPLVVAGLIALLILFRRPVNARQRPRWIAGPAGVSGVLLLLALAAWAASYRWAAEIATPVGKAGRWEASLLSGRVQVLRMEDYKLPTPARVTWAAATPEIRGLWTDPAESGPKPDWQFGGISHENTGVAYAPGQASRCGILRVPMWMIVTVLAVLPAVRAGRFLRHRHRARDGACVRCGYDLRATPQRCPECGWEPRP